MSQNDNDHGPFYGIGKGVFLALLLVALPGYLIVTYYERIEGHLSELSDLPVYDQMQGHFKTGAEELGGLFVSKLRQYYVADSSLSFFKPTNEAPPIGRTRYWHRATVASELTRALPSHKQGNVQAYLDYIEKYKGVALAEMRHSKIPASVTLAQGLFEGNAGRGYLAAKANNHFGIKCQLKPTYRRDRRMTDDDFDHHSLAIGCVQRTDDYVWDRFEVYPSASESFRRHSILLQGQRYNWMIRHYEIGEYYNISRPILGKSYVPYYAAWCVGLKQSGYATAKNYAEMITMIIETYQLWKIDYELIMA
ncbi:MAG: glucosaminidase domain-containing protein [Saprospiraceae bacterium]|nr:glucosaminidase domain-containing protein [Saprospiraceae bacterium]